MAHVLTKSDFPGKMQWTPVTKEGKRTAVIGCPHCAERSALQPAKSLEDCFGRPDHGFHIDTFGRVVPDMICSCGFRDLIFLKDWEPQTSPQSPKEQGK